MYFSNKQLVHCTYHKPWYGMSWKRKWMVVAFEENELNITGNPHTHEWARYFKLRASVTDAFSLQHKSVTLYKSIITIVTIISVIISKYKLFVLQQNVNILELPSGVHTETVLVFRRSALRFHNASSNDASRDRCVLFHSNFFLSEIAFMTFTINLFQFQNCSMVFYRILVTMVF